MPFLFTACWRLGAGKMKLMKQGDNDLSGFFRIMEDVGISYDTKICQYLDIKYLLGIVKNKKYYVKRKKKFPDNREKDFPLFQKFPIRPANDEEKKMVIRSAQQEGELYNSIKRYQELSELLTSCWSIRTSENILMWDRGDSSRACIQSSIGDFVSSFDSRIGFYIWCGKILYDHFSKEMNAEHKIWFKEPCYSDEREIRFYFSTHFDKVVPDSPNEDNKEGVYLKINPQTMIRQIILSPYVDKECASTLRETFSNQYNIQTTFSGLELSRK